MEKKEFQLGLEYAVEEERYHKITRIQVGTLWLLGKYNPLPLSADKILLEHSHIHSFT